MASTSASSIQKSFRYDVFLSFRGEDTRKTFVDHLYHALQHKSIHTYKDDERITKGKRISDELTRSIEESRFYVIVFSKNYASSSWCLDELVKIMECQKTSDRTAYPVFYDVEPTEVRYQSGAVGEGFAKLGRPEAAGKWREAMKEAADLAGWELKNTADGHEAKFIQKIAEEISLKLRFIDSSVDGKLIGMESRVKSVVSALETGSDDVRMIGIKGMGGAGKTTLARAVFDHLSGWFEGKSFVENVREVSKASFYGLKKLQKQVLSDVLNDERIKISSVHDGKNMMKKMMRCKRVLVVLDDVDCIDQLEVLAGEPTWFKPGSRIIITTRDEQVLVAHRVNLISDINLLSDEEAICLFSMYAFGKVIPIQGYEELSGNVVSYAAGLPLTIRVLGSFLCGKNEVEWKDAIDRLKTIPLRETLEKLELSYIGLEEDYKEIFLDVACILKGWEKEKAVEVLESCGFHARNGLRVLEQKSLITVSENGYLGMLDHIEEMGKNIVRRLHPNEPWMHSRLWIQEEIEDILTNALGTEATRCIKMQMTRNDRPETFIRGFGKMKELRVIHIYGYRFSAIRLCQCFPHALRYLRWDGYHFKSLMKSFQADHLVGLPLHHNGIIKLWKCGERKVLRRLRFLDMTYSDLETLDLEMTPNIETLNLKGCHRLVGLNMPIEYSKLKSLNLESCKMLRTLILGSSPDLETLSLEGCHDLLELHMPFGCPKLKSFSLGYSALKNLNLGWSPDLETLSLKGCHDLLELHMPFQCPKLKSLGVNCSKLRTLKLESSPDLETLSLEGCHDLLELHMPFQCPKLKSLIVNCSKLRTLKLESSPDLETLSLKGCHDLLERHMLFQFPKLKSLIVNFLKLRTLNLGWTPDLETLSLEGCHDLLELHMPFRCPKLKSFSLNNLALKNLNLEMTPNIEMLSLAGCHRLVELKMPFNCSKLKSFSLNNSALNNLNLGSTPDLETLILEKCSNLIELNMPFGCPKLKSLSLSDSKLRSLDLGLTPNLERLNIEECFNLVELHCPIGCLEKLVYLNLRHCGGFKYFLFDKKIQSPKVGSLHLIADFVDICPLHSDSNLPKFRFSCLHGHRIPSSIGNLRKLISVVLCTCTNLERFSESICNLQGLRKLTFEGSIPEVPKDLDRLQSLEELSLLSTTIKHLPDSICMLKNLKLLKLNSCLFIEKLPEGLGQLERLEDFNLSGCVHLQDIPKSICELKRLKCFNLSSCWQVKKLPRELIRLECLKELNIKDTGIIISDLPNGIFELEGLHIVASHGFSCTVGHL